MDNILQQSRNCHRLESAHRAAVLIDGETYFRVLHQALRRARHSVFIVGWDLHSEVRLIRDGDTGGYPERLGKLLDTLAKRRPGLEIYLLSWDFAMIYAMEREFFPRYKLEWRTHKRIHFALDGRHPVGASQHQKVVVIDDRLLRVGSSNLSNRSMGLDSECDLAIAAAPEDKDLQEAIGKIRTRLLAQHLERDPEDIAETLAESGSLIRAIDSLRGGGRTLAPLPVEVPAEVDRWVPESRLIDPEQPVPPEKLLALFVPPEQQPAAYRHAAKAFLIVAVVAALAAVWRWTPLGDRIDLEALQASAAWIQQQPLAPLLVAAAYVLGGLVALPITLMIIATVVVFGPWMGFLYASAGSWLSAMVVFSLGRWMGRDLVRRFAGTLLNRLSRKLSASGLLAVITVRIVPVAPFSVVNLIAGVSEIRWSDFALDRIWVRPQRRLSRLHAFKTPLSRMASDHLPLVAEIDL